MEVEFRLRGITYETKSIVPVMYSGHCVGHGEADLIVFFPDEENYVIELKAVSSEINRLHTSQLGTYLRGRTDVQHGVVINFTQPSHANAVDQIQYKTITSSPSSESSVSAAAVSSVSPAVSSASVKCAPITFSDNVRNSNDDQ
jgi:GxxExxY protein